MSQLALFFEDNFSAPDAALDDSGVFLDGPGYFVYKIAGKGFVRAEIPIAHRAGEWHFSTSYSLPECGQTYAPAPKWDRVRCSHEEAKQAACEELLELLQRVVDGSNNSAGCRRYAAAFISQIQRWALEIEAT